MTTSHKTKWRESLILQSASELIEWRLKADKLQAENERLQTINRELKSQLDIATDLGEKRFQECEVLKKTLAEIRQLLTRRYEGRND